MGEIISEEQRRALWEKAQEHRRKRALRAKRRGKCRTCHVKPPRSPKQTTCLDCHAAYKAKSDARKRAARKAEREAAAAAERAKKRAVREGVKAGENRAYLDFRVP